MVNLREISMNGSMRNVITMDQYCKSPDLYPANNTAIDMGNGYIYPLITRTEYERGDIGVTINPESPIQYFNAPKNPEKYSIEHNIENGNLVDFSDCKNYNTIISKQKAIKELRSELLTNADSITNYKIDDNDTPLMAAVKEAINSKECDINLYGHDPNDIRILNGNSITAAKAVKFADMMDMKITVTIEDTSPDVPNPMGKTITKVLTGGGE